MAHAMCTDPEMELLTTCDLGHGIAYLDSLLYLQLQECLSA